MSRKGGTASNGAIGRQLRRPIYLALRCDQEALVILVSAACTQQLAPDPELSRVACRTAYRHEAHAVADSQRLRSWLRSGRGLRS
jgi:hypothetical protein